MSDHTLRSSQSPRVHHNHTCPTTLCNRLNRHAFTTTTHIRPHPAIVSIATRSPHIAPVITERVCRPNGTVVMFFHNVGGWGTAVSAAVAATARGPYIVHVPPPSSQRTMPGQPFANQIFVHPCEDPFAWWDAAANRFRMLLHTFRMGMVCGAGTAKACGDGVPLGGGE